MDVTLELVLYNVKITLEDFEVIISRWYPGFFIPELIKKARKMRQIKFRAWDNNEKRMVDWKELLLSNDRWNLVSALGGEFHPTNPPKYFYEVMQFTEVVDKNGKEIYDGDILTFNPSIENNKSCIWKNVCHIWFRNTSDGAIISYNHPYSENSDLFSSVLKSFYDKQIFDIEYEVIGNIFENPELMKEFS